jgi:serine/threonine protein kinase
MREDSKAMPARLSTSEFLSAIEESGILPAAKSREVHDRLASRKDLVDPSALAHHLVEEGTLTSFQARRLLKGEKGLVFGRYILLDLIGQGARGRVFKARHRLMDRVVALKMVLPDDSLSQTSVARFFREMKIVGLLDHPNVVRAIDADEHEGCPYIVMEYLEGQDLEHLFVHRGPLPPDELIPQMAQACRGLAHAHEKGVIHRDVKPTNLFLVDTGVVKVLDLGFGELVGAAEKGADPFDTDEGRVVGTTDYMSPEQITNQPVDARTDLFSLGCAMYRLLTGCFAFPGETREHRLVKRIRERPVPLADVRPGLPDGLVQVVDRLLAARPDDRFRSAAEVADALEALCPTSLPADHRGNERPGGTPSGDTIAPVHSEPEPPLDWALIESALRPTGHAAREAPHLVDRKESRPPSSKGLSSHRQSLEEEGSESGREVHEKYRNELITMNRVMSELRTMEPKDKAPETSETWLERLGEKIGDSLAEPSAGQILIAILAVLLVLALAMAIAIG